MNKCELCGRRTSTNSPCSCIERTPDEEISIVKIKEGDVVNSPYFGNLIVRGIGFRWPEFNEVVKDPFLQLAVFWVEHQDGSRGWMDLSLKDRDPEEYIRVGGWNKFREVIGQMYPSADKKRVILFIERIASNEFRKKNDFHIYGKTIFFPLFKKEQET